MLALFGVCIFGTLQLENTQTTFGLLISHSGCHFLHWLVTTSCRVFMEYIV
jgi:hypothetical protein